MYLDSLILAAGLVTILAGPISSTNGIEWLGKRPNLPGRREWAVSPGSSTAMPETMVPADCHFVRPGGTPTRHRGYPGAPFMLSTLASGVVGLSKMVYCRCQDDKSIDCKYSILMRDLKFFILFYSAAVGSAFIPYYLLKVPVALALVAGYVYYVKKTLRDGDDLSESDLAPLTFWRKSSQPPLAVILFQIGFSLALIAGGRTISWTPWEISATSIMVPALILSLIITPIATELPEKFNSVIWVKGGKDTLAMVISPELWFFKVPFFP